MTIAMRPSVDTLFNPRSIAVVGASERPDAVGTRVIANLRMMSFPGRIYPVNPRYSELDGVICYPSLSALPEPVDAAFLGVPAAAGPDLLEEAARCGIQAAFINASGYADGDAAGRALQRQIVEIAARTGIALCGPNNIGLVNVYDHKAIWTPANTKPFREGPVGVISQSGSIALILSEDERDLGFAYVVTTGNEPVVTVSDYLWYMVHDDRVNTILLFLETVRNPELFDRAAREAARRGKRIIALKLGASDRGRALVQAHTGSLAGEDRLYDAFFKDLGVVRVRDLDEMLETAVLLSRYPAPPPAPGTVVLTLSGGEAALVADLGDELSLELPVLADETIARMRPAFPPYSTIGNPVDAWGLGFNAERFRELVDALLLDPAIGTLAFSVDAPGRGGGDVPYACVMARACAAAKTDKYLLFFNNTSGSGVNAEVRTLLDAARIPYLSGMRQTVAALRNLTKRAPQPVALEMGLREAQAIPANESARFDLLESRGVPMANTRAVHGRDDAIAAAQQLGFPVVLKGTAAHLPHKSDLGLVHLGLPDAQAVGAAFDKTRAILVRHEQPGAHSEIVLQGMAANGIELIVGIRNVPGFGSFIIVGPGGVLVELVNQASIRRGPVDERQAIDMLNETAAGKLLAGVRGKGPWDLQAAARAIAAFSRFGAAQLDALASLEINPLIVGQHGALGVDVLFEPHHSEPENHS